MWTLAHEQGIALPVKDYWDFVELVSVDPRGVEGLPQLGVTPDQEWVDLLASLHGVSTLPLDFAGDAEAALQFPGRQTLGRPTPT